MAKGKKKHRKDEGTIDQAVTMVDAPTPKKDKKAEGKKHNAGFDALAKLAEHPLLSELLAVGAIAAVGVITEHRKLGEVEAKSANAVRAAGKAAAGAIGARLLKEFNFGGGKTDKKA
jgi:hypothetical protein